MATGERRDEAGGFWRRHLDKVGIGGSLFAALCCLGFPALLSILSAVGLGFLINDAVLVPLLIAFLIAALIGLFLGMHHHHRPWALLLGGLSAMVTFVAVGVNPSGLFAGIGIAGLVVASLLNVWLRSGQLRRP
ncbi:MAG: MerC domain-containing protein [Reyranella sp.]|uniref:MerC domain-containing protein n=1 Tax=Reyranella sp. TaxID=1929291 RepID=UPI001AD59322|nr:MerC domain-containing protein [Reyranella sp.]MBN9086735.1 MerC domain-containing protein [Reyranella sp.]